MKHNSPRRQRSAHFGKHQSSGRSVLGIVVGIIVIAVLVIGTDGYMQAKARHESLSTWIRQSLRGKTSMVPQIKNAVKKKPVKALPKPLPTQVLLKVPPQSQLPQLPNGAEVTTLSMLLSAVGHPVSKTLLAQEVPKDLTKEVVSTYKTSSGQTITQILQWGDPAYGYVGNMYVAGKGYGVYNGPILQVLNKNLPGRAINLTSQPFSKIVAAVGRGTPVEVWTTLNFKPTTAWISWKSPHGVIRATPDENAALIVGYNQTAGTVSVDNPETGTLQTVAMTPFIQAWQQLGSQAVTAKPAPLKRSKRGHRPPHSK